MGIQASEKAVTNKAKSELGHVQTQTRNCYLRNKLRLVQKSNAFSSKTL